MSGDRLDGDEATKAELQTELRQTRSQLRALESELAETNEGMVALTLELENAKERYQTIFEESTDGILLIDPEEDTIREANPQVCELLGYDHDVLVTLSPADIFPDESDRSETFAEAVVHGWAAGFTCRTKDGRKIDVDISASMVTLDGQSLLLASLRDVTERKRREQRLQVLSRIFRHNLRNDGNIIQGRADVLHDELSDSDLQASALEIRRTIDKILQLSSKVRRIEDVLDRNQVDRRPISDLFANQQEWFGQTYPESTLTINLPAEGALVGRRLTVALREAIENGVKHRDGESTISISVEIDDDRELIRIDIEDDGPGIPEYEREVIRSGGETPLTHGSGIGLWFMYWVIDSLGGDLTIRDGEPTGTIISMVLPAEAEQNNA